MWVKSGTNIIPITEDAIRQADTLVGKPIFK